MNAEVFTPALAAAIWPPALLFVAFLLGLPSPRRGALVYLAGAVVITLGVGFAAVLLLQGAGLTRGRHPVAHAWIDLVLGAGLLAFAVAILLRPGLISRSTRRERRELGALAIFAAGMAMYSPSPFYLASLHAISKEELSATATALDVILAAGIYLAMIEIPIVLYLVWPERTTRWLDAGNRQLARHGRTVVIIAAAGFGIFLLANGIKNVVG